MVVRSLKDGERLKEPLTRGEARKVVRTIMFAIAFFGIVNVLALYQSFENQQKISQESTNRLEAITASRYQSWIDNCNEINQRNRGGLKALESFDSPTRQTFGTTQVRQLIDALAPYRTECAAYARDKIASSNLDPR